MNPTTKSKIVTVAAGVFAVLFGAYFVALSILTYDITQDGDLFPTKLDRLTDTYVSYLDPKGETQTREQAQAWLKKALDDLNPLDPERLLKQEIKTWYDLLGTLPPTWKMKMIWETTPDFRPTSYIEPSSFEQLIDSDPNESIEKQLYAKRVALTPFHDATAAVGKFAAMNELNDKDFLNYMVNTLAVAYRKAIYLSQIAPAWTSFDLTTAEEEGIPVQTLRAELKAALDAYGAEEATFGGLLEQAERLLTQSKEMNERKLCQEVDNLRSNWAPGEAKKRILFFGPLCLRRLTRSLLSDSEMERKLAWVILVEIADPSPDMINSNFKYSPEQQEREVDASGRAQARKEREKAVARIRDFYWKSRGWFGLLEPGIQQIY